MPHPEGTRYNGTTTPNTSSVPNDNGHGTTNSMVPPEPSNLSCYQKSTIPSDSQEPSTDSGDSTLESISPVCDDIIPPFHIETQFSGVFLDRNHGSHGENGVKPLDARKRGGKALPPIVSPRRRVGFQHPDKRKQAVTMDKRRKSRRFSSLPLTITLTDAGNSINHGAPIGKNPEKAPDNSRAGRISRMSDAIDSLLGAARLMEDSTTSPFKVVSRIIYATVDLCETWSATQQAGQAMVSLTTAIHTLVNSLHAPTSKGDVGKKRKRLEQ